MAKDINIPIKAEGAEQAKEKIDSVTKSIGGLGSATEKVGRQSTDGASGLDGLGRSAEKTHGGFSKMISALTGWAASIVSVISVVRLLTSVVTANRDALKEHADVAERQQQKLARLQYLGGFFQENPELRKEVAAYSEASGRASPRVGDW